MSKITQFIVFIVYASFFVILGVVLLGRNIQTAIQDTLAREFMQQQIVIVRQVSTSVESQIVEVREKLTIMTKIEEVREGTGDACSAVLEDMVKKERGDIATILRVGKRNVVNCASDQNFLHTDAKTLIPNLESQTPRDISFVGQLAQVDGREVLSVVLPFGAKDGDQEEYLAGFFYLEDFTQQHLSSLQQLPKGTTLIIDGQGVILFASNKDYTYLVGKTIDVGGIGPTPLLQSQGFQRVYKRALLGYSGTGQYVIGKEDTLFIYDVVSMVSNQKWAIVMFVPRSEIETEVGTIVASYQRTFMMLLVGTILFLGGVIILVFVFQIARPIDRLKKVALDIARGRLDVGISWSSNDEIGQLAAALSQMEEKLRKSYTQLEEKVRQRTNQLAERIQQLSREKAKDDAILSSIGEGLIVTAHDGNIVLINEEAEKLLGVTRNQVIGKMFGQVVQVQDEKGNIVPAETQPIFMAVSSARRLFTTFSYVRPDQTKILVAVNVSSIIMGGEIIGVVQIFRDITKEKEVDRMKTEFISLASHQLRTPLSAMKWFLEMLLAGDAGALNHEQTYFVENVNRSNERMIQLVNALLNVSRIESGRIIIDPRPTDLGKLFDEVLTEYVKRIEVKKQQLSVSVHPQLPIVNVDPKLIREVYSNLLSNAIKYTPSGGEISVFISKKEDKVLFQITDTGYGITGKESARVFQKFFRGENIIPVESEGSGLGLYLTKAVVESSGGQIWFESQEGKGTTFWFSLPLSGSLAKKGEVSLNA